VLDDSRRAAVNSRVSSGLMKREERLLDDLVCRKPQQLGNGVLA